MNTRCLTFTSNEIFSIKVVGTPMWDGAIEYSFDGFEWIEYDGALPIYSQGSNLYLRGKQNSVIDTNFQTNGSNIYCYGYIESLLDSDSYTYMSIVKNYCFANLFKGSVGLVKAPDIYSESTIPYEFQNAFADCADLVIAPFFQFTNIAENACQSMFKNDVKLTQIISKINVDSIQAYGCASMFEGCTALTSMPIISANTIGNYGCSNMFKNDTNLINVYDMYAISIGSYACYAMFMGCTSLAKAINFPNTSLNTYCFREMYKNCTHLTKLMNVNVTTLSEGCFYQMYYGCTSLKISTTTSTVYQYEFKLIVSSSATEPNVWNYQMFTNTGGTFTSNPSKNVKYYSNVSQLMQEKQFIKTTMHQQRNGALTLIYPQTTTDQIIGLDTINCTLDKTAWELKYNNQLTILTGTNKYLFNSNEHDDYFSYYWYDTVNKTYNYIDCNLLPPGQYDFYYDPLKNLFRDYLGRQINANTTSGSLITDFINGTLSLNPNTHFIFNIRPALYAEQILKIDNNNQLLQQIKINTNGNINISATSNEQIYNSAENAQMILVSQSNGSLTVRARGIVPNIDIPCTISIM